MNRILAIISLIFLTSLFTQAWGESRFIIESEADVVQDKKLSDVERCKKAYEAKDYAGAYPACIKAADQGDAEAQFQLGSMHYYGRGVKQDNQEAVKWYRKAADQGNVFAQITLGAMYDQGQGVQQDYAEAAVWYHKAAEKGDKSDLGRLLLNGKAQFRLGFLYFEGKGVKKDPIEAMKWYRKAAEQGLVDAQTTLGILYEASWDKNDYAEAAKWFRKAAEQGEDNAQYFLGKLYYMGKGVKQDTNEASSWFRKAADQGNTSAKLALDQLFKGPAEASVWYRKQAEGGNSDAQYELAKRYISGEGVEKNRHLAEKWLVHSIVNDDKNRNSIDLIEKEFGWHCILKNESECIALINKSSINHDKNLSWYWWRYITKSSKTNDNNMPVIEVFQKYDVMNCDNRTLGNKTKKMLDENLINKEEGRTINDNEIEFVPLDPSTYSNNLFNYVCGTPNAIKQAEDAQEVFFGTGWTIQPGYIVTNQHVVNGKKHIAVMLTTGKKISATILMEDKINDLALLQVNQPGKLPPALPVAKSSAKTGSKVFITPAIKHNNPAVGAYCIRPDWAHSSAPLQIDMINCRRNTIGYPHPDMMGAKPKLTEGIVNAVTGYMDDPRTLQISVPVQGGNSGGPLLNMNGEVIGIVTAKLSAIKMFNWTGDLPQNVNYAVKIAYLSALLSSVNEQASGIKALPSKPASLESLSSRIQNSILMIIAE